MHPIKKEEGKEDMIFLEKQIGNIFEKVKINKFSLWNNFWPVA